VQVGNVDLKLRRLLATEAGDHLPREMLETLSFVPEKILGQRKYRIRGVIARGSLGVVLEAEDVSTRRRVALKTLLENDSTQAGIRFSEEAQIMAQLEHPNIVRVYESNVNEHDRPFYSMQLAHGDSLKRAIHAIRLQRPASHERWRLDVLLEAFCKACDAMAYAHAKRVVHRDLQPQNILLGDFGEVLVMDWGHAKVLGDRVHGFSAPDTPQFTAPEQLTPEPREIDPRVDVYSLGAMLYNLLTLHMPFRASDPAELLEKIGQGKITAPEEAVENQPLPHLPDGKLPGRLAAVALKAMSLDPTARHASVPDFQTELRAAAHENGGARGGLFGGLFGRHK
jgi:serine/threonine protein kinase